MIRVFPRRTNWTPTDPLSFVGDPPLYLPPLQPVRVSVAFTWDRPEGERLARSWRRYYPDVRVGGPAYDDPGQDFIGGQFVRDGAITTSRGCPKNCPWCFVPRREGAIRELPIVPGNNLFDNNLLACSKKHIETVFDMLRGQSKIIFSGGLDVTLLKQWHVDLLKQIKLLRVYFACDTIEALPILENAAGLLDEIPKYKKFCYVLVGLNNETVVQAESRLITVWELGFMPQAMLFRGLDCTSRKTTNKDWQNLVCCWSRPAIYKAHMKLIEATGNQEDSSVEEALFTPTGKQGAAE